MADLVGGQRLGHHQQRILPLREDLRGALHFALPSLTLPSWLLRDVQRGIKPTQHQSAVAMQAGNMTSLLHWLASLYRIALSQCRPGMDLGPGVSAKHRFLTRLLMSGSCSFSQMSRLSSATIFAPKSPWTFTCTPQLP